MFGLELLLDVELDEILLDDELLLEELEELLDCPLFDGLVITFIVCVIESLTPLYVTV